MQEFADSVQQFFHSWIFTGFLFAAITNCVITFRSFMINRSEKNTKRQDEKTASIVLTGGFVFFGWAFYSMSFTEFGFDMLNVAFIVTFAISLLTAVVISYDKWKIGQQSLDKYT